MADLDPLSMQQKPTNTFTKVSISDVEYEWQRSSWLYQLSLRTELFRCPIPICYSANPAQIIFSHLPEAYSLNRLLVYASILKSSNLRLQHAFALAGRSLAYIHNSGLIRYRDTLAPQEMIPQQHFDGLYHLEKCVVHGDFWGGNIFLDHHERLWLIDPVPRDVPPRSQIWNAYPEFDVARMLVGARALQPIWALPMISDSLVRHSLRVFLSMYCKEAGVPLCTPTLSATANELLARYRSSVRARLRPRHARIRLYYADKSATLIRELLRYV